MTNLGKREGPTLTAINQLARTYPYAAALLTYVMIERLLKGYVLKHRNDSVFAQLRVPPHRALGAHKGKTLAALSTLADDQFLAEVLCKMTLGDVESMLKIPVKQRAAPDRNDTMHSNLYLGRQEAELPHPKREAENRRRLKRGLRHLRCVLRRCTGLKLVV